MSNWIDYDLDVLAASQVEINQIAERLQQPSAKLVELVAQRCGEPADAVRESLKDLLQFEATKNLGFTDASVNKARRFSLIFKNRSYGIVDSHLFEVSAEYPSAIFLLTHSSMEASYSGKQVIRAGEVAQTTHEIQQRSQGVDWALIDIFSPFVAEYYENLPFGRLWQEWLEEIAKNLGELKDQSSATRGGIPMSDARPRDAENSVFMFAVKATRPE